MTTNQSDYKVDLSGKRARRRYPSRDLPTIFSGEASSLHSSEYEIFFGASSLGDDESDAESYSSRSTNDHSQSTHSHSASGSFSPVEEESYRDSAPSRPRSDTDPSFSSESEYSSGSPWASGTGSSSSSQSEYSNDDASLSRSSYETSPFVSVSESAGSGTADTDEHSTELSMGTGDEMDSVLDSILSELTPPGVLKENPIVIDDEVPCGLIPSLSSEEATVLSDREEPPSRVAAADMPNAKTADQHDCTSPKNSLLLKHVNYGPGIEIASTSRDVVSTINFLSRKETQEAFHQEVPKVLACIHLRGSFGDDVSTIDNRSLKERMKDRRRKNDKPKRRLDVVVDEELGFDDHPPRHRGNTTKAMPDLEHPSKYFVWGGKSEMELCFFVLITVALFTLIILIAILVAQN